MSNRSCNVTAVNKGVADVLINLLYQLPFVSDQGAAEHGGEGF